MNELKSDISNTKNEINSVKKDIATTKDEIKKDMINTEERLKTDMAKILNLLTELSGKNEGGFKDKSPPHKSEDEEWIINLINKFEHALSF